MSQILYPSLAAFFCITQAPLSSCQYRQILFLILVNFFRFAERTAPSGYLAYPTNHQIRYTGDIAEADLGAFEEKFFNGELTPTLKSEEPSDEDLAEPVKVIKGKSFSKMVLENGKPTVFYFISALLVQH